MFEGGYCWSLVNEKWINSLTLLHVYYVDTWFL